MRDELCRELVGRSGDERMVFLTGDLGFMALEPLRDALGPRFINCGVAEQNMVSVAAALTYEGLEAWTYTIAPFCYARAFEQIRNDVCLHGLAVKLLANGGGYAYGVMGPTHHALEDYGILLTLPNMTAFVPAFAEDVGQTLERAGDWAGPAYIRLGRGEKPEGEVAPAYAPWRCLLGGGAGVMIAAGPLAGSAWGVLRQFDPASRPALWAVSELPIEANPPPLALTDALGRTRRLAVVEEHVAHGGVGQAMCRWVVEAGIGLDRFRHLHASPRTGATYGSQVFMRRRSGLDPEGIALAAKTLAS
jgi:transketolase